MAMSKDRVRFYIREQYFSTQAKRLNMAGVMAKAFGLPKMGASDWLRGNGVWVTCRPSQFARFMIYRNDANIVNGFMDLRAELIKVDTRNAYDLLAEIAGITHDQAKRVSLALCYSGPQDILDRITPDSQVRELDVSANTA